MKTRIIRIWLLCSLIFSVSCNNNKIQDVSIDGSMKIIDMDNTKKEDLIPMSEFFSHAKTIILETGDNILLGKIKGIQVYNDLIFILDAQQDMGVYIFNKTGKFIRKIGKIGRGPGEYLTVSDFTIDQDNDNIYLLDCDANKIYKYKITGEFEASIALKNTNIQSFHLQYNNGNLYTDVNYLFENETENGYVIQEIDTATGKQKARWLDSYKYNKNWNGALQRADESFFYSRNQESFKFVHFFMNTIISFSENSVEPAFILKDKDWITQNDVLQIKKERDENGGAISFESLFNRDIAFNINNYMEWGDFVSFRYQKKDDSFFVLHNVKTQTTRMTSILIDDLVYREPSLPSLFACTDSTGLYGIAVDGQLLRLIERVKEDGFLNPDLDKIDELKNIPEDSNPVIFFYKFKDTR
jgi:hypothetical protein